VFSPKGFIPVSALFENVPDEIHEWFRKEYRPELGDVYWYTPRDLIENLTFGLISQDLFVFEVRSGFPFKIHSANLFNFSKATQAWAVDALTAVDNEDLLANFSEEELISAKYRLLRENILTLELSRIKDFTPDKKQEYAASVWERHRFNTVQPLIDRRSYSLSKKAFKAASIVDEFASSFTSNNDFLLKHFNHCPLTIEVSFYEKQWRKHWQKVGVMLRSGADDLKTEFSSGRPRKRDEIAKRYTEKYPSGHQAQTWKEVCLDLTLELDYLVTVDTLKRGLGLKQ
jgi:hypothetical protein